MSAIEEAARAYVAVMAELKDYIDDAVIKSPPKPDTDLLRRVDKAWRALQESVA